MERGHILNLLNESNDSKFMTKKLSIANDQWNTNYDVGNKIIYNTEVLKSNRCDYINAHILEVSFKNCAPFTKCIAKIDGTTIDDAYDLDLAMPMYILIWRLWFFQKMKQLILMQTSLTAIVSNRLIIRLNWSRRSRSS